jgi:hypothetical protein
MSLEHRGHLRDRRRDQHDVGAASAARSRLGAVDDRQAQRVVEIPAAAPTRSLRRQRLARSASASEPPISPTPIDDEPADRASSGQRLGEARKEARVLGSVPIVTRTNSGIP